MAAAGSGMALHQSLESQLGQQAGLFVKWPNDLVGRQADGSFKKLAGILCESRSGERSFAVCGIGINLCQPASFFEQAGLPDAGSVAQVFCCVPDAYQLLEEIGVHLQNWLLLLKADPKQLLDAYSARCITLGRQVCICREGQTPTEAKAIRIDSDGQLVCLTQKRRSKGACGRGFGARALWICRINRKKKQKEGRKDGYKRKKFCATCPMDFIRLE